jgi:hypothetical protein
MDKAIINNLKEAQAAAQAEVQALQGLSDASAKIQQGISEQRAIRAQAEAASTLAAELSAKRYFGEATDAEVAAATKAASDAGIQAQSAALIIEQLERQLEIINQRYATAHAVFQRAQANVNGCREAAVLGAADDVADEYIDAVVAARAALLRLLGHSKALEMVRAMLRPGQTVSGFTDRYVFEFPLPGFTLPAFATRRDELQAWGLDEVAEAGRKAAQELKEAGIPL